MIVPNIKNLADFTEEVGFLNITWKDDEGKSYFSNSLSKERAGKLTHQFEYYLKMSYQDINLKVIDDEYAQIHISNTTKVKELLEDYRKKSKGKLYKIMEINNLFFDKFNKDLLSPKSYSELKNKFGFDLGDRISLEPTESGYELHRWICCLIGQCHVGSKKLSHDDVDALHNLLS